MTTSDPRPAIALARRVGTFIDAQYATGVTREDMLAALERALLIERALPGHTCEYTPDGTDPRPGNEACGKPATTRNPQLVADYEEWYCAEHADPAWSDDVCGCSHDRADHAFFPSGDPAPLCVGEYMPEDPTLIDHTCQCDGYDTGVIEPVREGALANHPDFEFMRRKA